MTQGEGESNIDPRSEYFPSTRTRTVANLCVDLESTYITKAIKKPEGFSDPANLGRIADKVQDSLTAKTFNLSEDCDVLCVNCMTMVSMSMVAEHSLWCTKVDTQVRLMDECPLLRQADFCIRKLLESIEQLENDKELLCQNPNNPCNIKMLTEYAGDLKGIEDCTSEGIRRCSEVVQNLNVVTANFAGSPKLKLYLERLFVLSKEKHVELKRSFEDMHSGDPASGVAVVKSTEELLAELCARAERFRKTKDRVHTARASLGSGKSLASPAYICRTNQAVEDVNSAIHSPEYSSLLIPILGSQTA